MTNNNPLRPTCGTLGLRILRHRDTQLASIWLEAQVMRVWSRGSYGGQNVGPWLLWSDWGLQPVAGGIGYEPAQPAETVGVSRPHEIPWQL